MGDDKPAVDKASDDKLLHECGNRFRSTLGFRFGFGSLPAEAGKQFVKTGKQFLKQSVTGAEKFRVVSKPQLFDHIRGNVLRSQDSNLAFDPTGISW